MFELIGICGMIAGAQQGIKGLPAMLIGLVWTVFVELNS
jgi:hypothetical protein